MRASGASSSSVSLLFHLPLLFFAIDFSVMSFLPFPYFPCLALPPLLGGQRVMKNVEGIRVCVYDRGGRILKSLCRR